MLVGWNYIYYYGIAHFTGTETQCEPAQSSSDVMNGLVQTVLSTYGLSICWCSPSEPLGTMGMELLLGDKCSGQLRCSVAGHTAMTSLKP